MILQFFIFFIIKVSAVTICICDNTDECIRKENICEFDNSFNPGDDSKTDEMYAAIEGLIDRESEVTLKVLRTNYYVPFYKPQMKISPFIGKKINFETSSGSEPSQFNFSYTEYNDLSSTKMITPYAIVFVHDSDADQIPHDQIDVVFNEGLQTTSIYKGNYSVDPPVRSAQISFSGNSVLFSIYGGFTKFIMAAPEIKILLISSDFVFNITKEELYYNKVGYNPTKIEYTKESSIEIADGDDYVSNPLITIICHGYEDFSQFPKIKFDTRISRFMFKGSYPCPEDLSEIPSGLKNIGAEKIYNLKITFDLDKPQKFPFGFIGDGIYFHVKNDIEFVNLIDNKGTKFELESFSTDRRINVRFHEITTPQLAFSGTSLFDVVVGQFNFDASKKKFPVETNIGDLGITRTTIKSMSTISPEAVTSSLNVYGNISVAASAKKLHDIFDNFGPFLIFPGDVEWVKSVNFKLYYTYTVFDRVGFQNGDSWIDFKKVPDLVDNTMQFTFIWSNDPFEIPVKLKVFGSPGMNRELGPNVDLKELVDKYPDTIIFEMSMFIVEQRDFNFYSTIDLPLDNYQFTIHYVDNDDFRAQYHVDFSNVTKSKIKLMNYSRIKFLNEKVNIFGEKIVLYDCLYSKPGGITFDTEDLEIDTASLKDLSYPLKNSDGKETIKNYTVDIGKTIANKLTIHGNSSITSDDGAIIPFDAVHEVNFLAWADLTIACDPKLESIDKFYGFDVYITKPYSHMSTHLHIGNFPFISNIVSPINIFHTLESTLVITNSIQTQREIFTISGGGKYILDSDFGEQGIYCICESNNCDKYLPKACSVANSIKYDGVSSYISEKVKLSKIQFLVFNANESIEENCPIINVSVLQNKHVIFQLGIIDDQAKENGLKQIHNYAVTLNNDEKLENPGASKLQLEEHCSILMLTSLTESSLYLGDLLINSLEITFDGFSQVDLNITRLTISPTHVQSFKSIFIREDLTVNPFISESEAEKDKEWTGEVYFEENQDSINPRLIFNYGVFSRNIKLSDNLIIVGQNLRFNIPHQDSISAKFFISDVTTTIELLESATDVLLAPRINISGGSSDQFAITFIGNNWQKKSPNSLKTTNDEYIETDVIVLSNKKSLELTLSDVIPLSIDYQGETINVFASNFKVGMNSIHFHEISREQNKYQLVLNSKMKEENKNVSIIFSRKFKVDKHQTVIDYGDSIVEITHAIASIQTFIKGFSLYDGNGNEMIINSDQMSVYNKPIALELHVKMTHLLINCLTIENYYYPTYISSISFETKLNKDHIKSLPNHYDDFHVIKHGSMSIVKAPKNILSTYDVSTLKFKNIAIRDYQALGFLTDDNIFAFRYNERLDVYEMYTTMNIYDKPMKYQIIDDNSRRFVDTVSFIKGPDISTKIKDEFPSGKLKNIVIFFSINVLNEVIDMSALDSIIENRANFVLDSGDVNRKTTSIKISAKTLNLDINNLNIVKSEEMTGKSITVLTLANTDISKDSKFVIDNNINKLKATIYTYKLLLKNNQLNSYSNDLALYKVKIITFTKSGWEVLENQGTEILVLNSTTNSHLLTTKTSTNSENLNSKISLECSDAHVQLHIKEPGTMEEVKLIPITYIDPIDVTLGKGWNFIKNANNLKVHIQQTSATEGKEIAVFSSSYPIVNLFDNDKNWEFKFDDQSSDFSIELYDNYKITKKAVFDLTTLIDPKKQILSGKTVIFESYMSSVDFVNGKGYLNAVNIKVSNNSRSSISSGTFSHNLEMIEDSQLIIDLFTKDDEESLNIGNIDLYWNYANFPSITLAEKDAVLSLGENTNISIIYNGDQIIDNKIYNSILKNLKKDLFVGKFECINWTKKVKLISPKEIPEFSTTSEYPNGIFELSCNEKINGIQSLSIAVVKELPTDDGGDDSDDGGKDSKISDGGIVGICFAVFVVAAVSTGLIVYFCTRKKYERLMVATSFESQDLREPTTSANDDDDDDDDDDED